jgi:hypothetical protein
MANRTQARISVVRRFMRSSVPNGDWNFEIPTRAASRWPFKQNFNTSPWQFAIHVTRMPARPKEVVTAGYDPGCVKTKSDLVVMASGGRIFAFFSFAHDQNSRCGYIVSSFHTVCLIFAPTRRHEET